MENELDELIEIKKYLIRNYHSPKLLLVGLKPEVCNDLKKLFPVMVLEDNCLDNGIPCEMLEWCEMILCSTKLEKEISMLELGDIPIIFGVFTPKLLLD